jgi:hypothetical protein
VSGRLQAPAALTTGKEPPVTIGYEAGWGPDTVRPLWSRDESLALLANEPRPSSQWLYRLSNKIFLLHTSTRESLTGLMYQLLVTVLKPRDPKLRSYNLQPSVLYLLLLVVC